MVFNSFGFFVFFAIVLFLYFKLPKTYRWIMLLIASYYFYVSWNFQLLWLILFTTTVSYTMALLIAKTKRPWLKRLSLILTLLCCLGTLFFFKYFDFLSLSVTNALQAFGLPASKYTLNLILPVGISFYTFQTLSYVIDVYNQKIEAEPHFGYYALYVSFFPQLVAGPIERSDSLIPQLKQEHAFSWKNLENGGRIMIAGYVKKVVVADTIALHVNAVFNNAQEATGLSVLIATLLFAVQIYCDFSGYTDIAIGCAGIMGIKLMKNFDRPYSAKSIKEFWSRWHISLSSWLKDYVYIPLGGNRCSGLRHAFNLFIVFLASGIWHGANWTFVLWGVLHGMYQIVGMLTIKKRNAALEKMGVSSTSKPIQVLRQCNTFVLVAFAWILFRSNTIADFGVLISSLFTKWQLTAAYWSSSLESLGGTAYNLFICALCVLMMVLCDRLYTDGESRQHVSAKDKTLSMAIVKGKSTILVVWIILVAWMLLLSHNGTSSFIYFQF